MSVKSIGYSQGENFGLKQFTLPTITINEAGQITELSTADTPANVIITEDLTDTKRTINQQTARLGRFTDKYNELNQEYTDKNAEYLDVKNETDELEANVNLLFEEVVSQDAPVLIASIDASNFADVTYFRVGPINNAFPYTNAITRTPITVLKAGTYFLDVRLMLVSKQGVFSAPIEGGGTYTSNLLVPSGQENVIAEVRVSLNGTLINTFVGNGVDYYMGQIYVNGSTFIEVDTPNSTLQVDFWFSGNLPSNLDQATSGGNSYAWEISSSPKWTYPIEFGFGNFNSAANAAPTLSLYELNFV
jgi:hypothetical protein